MKDRLPALLTFNGGYVDTAGFLALHGLFTAHVTGNFVTLGASLDRGTSGAPAKLLALPAFCVVVILVRLLDRRFSAAGKPVIRTAATLEFLFLAVAAAMALKLGPFADGDTAAAILVGMLLVAAMAIQNAVHRLHLASSPPSTLMTGTTTQIMIDLSDILGGAPDDAAGTRRTRVRRMGVAVLLFAAGCAAAALLYLWGGMRCFLVPPVVALATLALAKPRQP